MTTLVATVEPEFSQSRPVAASPRIQRCLFTPVLEYVNLVLPFCFLVPGLLFAFLGIDLTPKEVSLLHFATSYVFMDLTHTGFTVLLFALVPETRVLLARAVQGQRLWFYLSLGLFLTFPVFLAAVWSRQIPLDPRWEAFALAAITGLWVQHAISQVFGISLLYHRHAGAPNYGVRMERYLFKVLILISAFGPFLQLNKTPATVALTEIFMVTYASAVAGILFISLKQHRISPSHKLVYQMRLLLWVASTVHPLVLGGVLAAHAVEYLCVCHKMVKNSAVRKSVLFVVFGLTLAFGVYPFVRSELPIGLAVGPLALIYLAGLARTFDYFHYYVDGILFRFKDPEVRALVGPLLTDSR